MTKMDPYREQSAARDAAKKPDVYELGADLDEHRHEKRYYGRMLRKVDKELCPECRGSTDFLRWDPYRQLYVHERCGFTATIDELLPEEDA